GRRHADLENTLGMFVNTLALHSYPAGKKRFADFLEEVKESANAAFENQDYPFERLVEKVALNRDAGRNPLFDVVFALLDIDLPAVEIPGLKLTPTAYDPGTAKFDLTFNCESGVPMGSPGEKAAAGEVLRFFVEYRTDLFLPESIERFIAYFKQVVKEVLRDRYKKIGEIEIIPGSEKQRILYEFNDTGEVYPADKTIPRLFVEQVERTPDNTAVVFEGEELSYEELDERASLLAYTLVNQGVRRWDLVGIMVDRSIEMIVGILGILKSGAGYVPLNPRAPLSRSRYILDECGVKLLLTAGEIRERISHGEENDYFEPRNGVIEDKDFIAGLSEEPAEAGPRIPRPVKDVAVEERRRPLSPVFKEEIERTLRQWVCPPHIEEGWLAETTAYVIFTSGSTGKPKGVPISHSNFCPLLHWGYKELGLGPKDRAIQNLSYYFDWSVWEIFIALTGGAALYMAPSEVLMLPGDCIEFMNKNQITVLHVTPTQYRYIVGVGKKLQSLKYLFIGAEKLTYDLVERSFVSVNEDCRVFNMYGPTEATIISAVLELYREDYKKFRRLSSIPIGGPVANIDLFVLDKNLRLCPVNVSGELYIAGDNLSTGYLNDQEKSRLSFIEKSCESLGIKGAAHPPSKEHAAPLSSHTGRPSRITLYRTGDLCRRLADGNIEFLGRVDYQVKIRGFRIEPGEIENCLLEHESVKDAVVVDLDTAEGEKYLCAYVVAEFTAHSADQGVGGTEVDLTGVEEVKQQLTPVLREYLSRTLPDYMIPSQVVFLDNIPLNPNGKVDRRALPEPEFEATAVQYAPPRGESEEKLVEIWSQVLGMESSSIGIDANFFEIGGHSLKATMLVAKIHKAFNVNIKLADIFRKPSIRGLTSYISSAVEDKFISLEPAGRKEYYSLSSAQKRLYLLQQFDMNNMTYNMPRVMLLEGEPDKKRLEKVLRRLVERHESFRTSFEMRRGEPVQKIHNPGEIEFKIEFEENPKLQIPNYKQITSHKSQITKETQPAADSMQKEAEGDGQSFPHHSSLIIHNSVLKFIRPFDLSKAPLLRVGLVKLQTGGKTSSPAGGAAPHILLVDMHHIISDGTSVKVFIGDFMDLYAGKELTPLPLQYKDFSEWQNSEDGKEAVSRQQQYWLGQFSGDVPVLKLPYDFPRPAKRSFAGASLEFEINQNKTETLRKLADEEGVTLFLVLLTVYNILLSKLSWSEDIVVGSPVVGRRFVEVQQIIGMFVNTVALRNYPRGSKTFKEFLQEVKKRTLEAFENQDYPFEDLVDEAAPTRKTSHNPMFDTMFTLQNIGVPEVELPGLKLKTLEYKHRFSRFDMTWISIEKEDSLIFTVEYSTALFKEEKVKNFAGFFEEIIDIVTAGRDICLKDIDIAAGLADSQESISVEASGDFDFV
ncbi:MAG: amino acid adenylation domain-containing protein, partial [Candidatus Aminicenantes bacterium]|nr:amino acid adenylation domain-containing protein [Candidatus Aminicenantes bacterium]